MYKIEEKLGHVVAADTQTTLRSVNDAIVNQSRMCATLVEVSSAANLPAAAVQESLRFFTQGLQSLVDNRQAVAEAVRQLAELQRRSNLREVNFGCPGGVYYSAKQAETRATAE